MPKLIDLLKSLAQKGKLDITKPEVIASLEAAKDIEVPQEFADSMEAALMTTDAAVSNPQVRARIKAEVLNGEDAYITSFLSDPEFDEETRNSITAETDTIKKIRKTLTSLNEKIKKAKTAGDKGTEASLKAQVADLNNQLKTIKDGHIEEIKKINSERDNDFTNYNLMALLGSKQYALPEKMTAQQKIKTALLSVQEALEQKGLKVVPNESKTGVKLLKKDGTDPYNDKNILLELPSFIDGVLAETGILKNSDPAQQGNNGHTPIIPAPNGNNGNAPVINHTVLKELDSTINGFLKG